MSNFNGQINISRDLRQNKQTILGKRDFTDLVFIVIGISVAVLLAYFLGFYFKVLDEFSAVVISLIPMVIILTFGFRKKAGIRWIYYLVASMYEKKSKNRSNRELLTNVIKINKRTVNKEKQKNEKHKTNIFKNIINIYKDTKNKKNENKKINENDSVDVNTSKKETNNKIVIDKTIFVLETDGNIKDLALGYIEKSNIEKVQVRLKNENKKLLLLENFSYKTFLNDYIKKEVNDIVKNEKWLKKLKDKIKYLIYEKKKYYNKFNKFLNLSSYNVNYFDEKTKGILEDFNAKNLKFINIDDEFIKNLNIKEKRVYMLHLYTNSTYELLINELKKVSEVVVNLIKFHEKYYVSTFIIFEGIDDKVFEILNKYNAIVNKLTNEQGTAKSQVGYYMFNPFNNYREYKI